MSGQGYISIAQMGARMHYAVPTMLAQASLLGKLYTDLPPGLRGGPREIRGARSRSFPVFGFRYALQRRMAKSRDALGRIHLAAGAAFCRKVVSVGLEGADAVYVFNSAGLEIMRHARGKGIRCFLEQTIAPKAVEARLLSEERERYPGWETDFESESVIEAFCEREREEWSLADKVICGSDFVADGIRSKSPKAGTTVVPYGVNTGNSEPSCSASGSPLRVLFAGSVGLRKGVGDLMRAMELLDSSAVRVKAVGTVTVSRGGREELSKHIKLLGRIARNEMRREYAEADVFVLPSICEGSATVIYEALAAGLPVITTPNAGSVVVDGQEGFIVPIRSPESIARRLEELISNRDLLEEMSVRARARAQQFTVDHYRERLLEALKDSDGIEDR